MLDVLVAQSLSSVIGVLLAIGVAVLAGAATTRRVCHRRAVMHLKMRCSTEHCPAARASNVGGSTGGQALSVTLWEATVPATFC